MGELKTAAFIHKVNLNTYFAAPNENKALSVSHMAGSAETVWEKIPSSKTDEEPFEFSN